MNDETEFPARVGKSNSLVIYIPKRIQELLKLRQGDLVLVRLKKTA